MTLFMSYYAEINVETYRFGTLSVMWIGYSRGPESYVIVRNPDWTQEPTDNETINRYLWEAR